MKPFFWIDLEMTGLDESVDQILEIAIVVTDEKWVTLDQYHRIVFQPPEVMEAMNDWCKEHHGKSGLTALIPNGTPLAVVEKEVTTLIDKFWGAKERVVLCGNSVGNDLRFLLKYTPELAKRLHYRIVDVSSYKEVFREIYKIDVKKKKSHRAIDDILESIEELKVYLSCLDPHKVELMKTEHKK